jgi:ABC-type hemin transport system ATPase subunit
MSIPHLPEVSLKLPSLCGGILDASAGAGSLWQIDGPPTAGKSTLLRLLSGELNAAGKRAVFVSPPQRARDSGAVALIQIAGSLKDAGMVNGQLSQLRRPRG